MSYSWKLPTSLFISGVDWQIETDFRTIIDVLIAFNSPDYDMEEKVLYCLMSVIKDFDKLKESDYKEALEKISEFIDMGIKEENNTHKLMDWEQDSVLIIPAVNKVIGHEIRSEQYMHWWTFLSAYMEIGESSFSHIVSIRNKQAKHIKLEKWENDFVRENKNLVTLNKKLSKEEKEEMDLLTELLG